MLVQRECGVKDPIRVAPLFETLDDLDHSESAMEQLLSNDWYSKHIKGEQECMIGYSDSGKDAGRLAAAWGLYAVQVRAPTQSACFGAACILQMVLPALRICVQPCPQGREHLCALKSITLPLLLSLLSHDLESDSAGVMFTGEAGVGGREVQCEADAVPRPRGNRRPRRGAHPPGHPLTAAGHHQRPPPRHHPGKLAHSLKAC